MAEQICICIALKCFYASAECSAMGLDPLKTNLAVADTARGNSAACLAVTPALKAFGVMERSRISEIPEDLDCIISAPRMDMYMRISVQIYGICLRFVSHEDIHICTIDEMFINVSPYLELYGKTPREFARMLMDEIMRETGIGSAAGIGTNLFLAKVALDITADDLPDSIGYLDEERFRQTVWEHQPMTDIWGIGRVTAARLERLGARTLKDITCISEESLYNVFGPTAEYLIDHANGRESCTIKDIQSYEPKSRSISNCRILPGDNSCKDAPAVLKEMTAELVDELMIKALCAGSVALSVKYSDRNIKHTGGVRKLTERTDSYEKISDALERLFTETTRIGYPVKSIVISFGFLTYERFEDLIIISAPVHEKNQCIGNRHVKNSVACGMAVFGKSG